MTRSGKSAVWPPKSAVWPAKSAAEKTLISVKHLRNQVFPHQPFKLPFGALLCLATH